MDFEEQIDLFFVKKENEIKFSEITTRHTINCKERNYSKDVFKCIPLMCKHVTRLNENWKDTNVIMLSDSVQFTHCLVYGKIMSKEKEYKTSFKYILDDGTASLSISLFRKLDDIGIICKMENELQSVRREMLTQNRNEMVDSLRNLLFKTKEQVDNADLPIGSKILVYGKPKRRKGEIILNVYCFIEDGKYNRDIEISFKDYLIYWYRNNCVFNKVMN